MMSCIFLEGWLLTNIHLSLLKNDGIFLNVFWDETLVWYRQGANIQFFNSYQNQAMLWAKSEDYF